MSGFPKELQEAIEAYRTLEKSVDKKEFTLDWLNYSKKINYLCELRDKIFSILKNTETIKTTSILSEQTKNRIISLSKQLLSNTEQLMVLMSGSKEVPTQNEYRKLCSKYAVEHAFLFYKLPVSDDYLWFINRWMWIADNVAKKHVKTNTENNHTKFLLGDEYKISIDDVEHLVSKYFKKDVKEYLYKNSPRFMFDKKETEFLKKSLLSELKERYPNATWNCKSFLLSNKNWNALCEDFFKKEEQAILDRINESNVLENSKNAFTFMVIISAFLNSYLDSWILNKNFEDYMVMRVEKEFQLSEQKKLKASQQNESKPAIVEQSVIESKSESKKKDLPVWMEDEIRDMDIIDVNQLIKFFKNELTNFGWHIQMSHLKDRLDRMSESESLPDILALLDNYPEFIVEDDERLEAEEESSLDWNLEEVDVVKKHTTEETLLNKLSKVSDKSNMEKRLFGYISIFEDLWFKFRDKKDFFMQLKDAVARTDKWCLENSIQTALRFRIHGNESLSKKKAFWYRAICLNHRSWRIVLTNMEITHILPHSEYEKLINTKPSQN